MYREDRWPTVHGVSRVGHNLVTNNSKNKTELLCQLCDYSLYPKRYSFSHPTPLLFRTEEYLIKEWAETK